MFELIWLVILVLGIIWAIRVETGLNKLNETAARIEAHLADNKKEKK